MVLPSKETITDDANKLHEGFSGMRDLVGQHMRAMRAAIIIDKSPEMDVGTTPAEVVYTENKLRLLHFHPVTGVPRGPPVLIVYALINKPYIMDLQPDRSVVRALLERGFDVYLIDWGEPTIADRHLTLEDYVDGYIDRCADQVLRRSGHHRLTLFGYCMGGTMAVMYTALHWEKVRNLIVMAAPVDGSVEDGLLHHWSRKEWYDVDRIVDTLGNVPGDFINLGYMMLDPVNTVSGKYVRLMDIVDDEKAVANYLRMEKWINDGQALAGETFRKFVKDVYQDNLLIANRMRLGGRTIDLGTIDVPTLTILGQYDNLVPPGSTRPFHDAIGTRDKEIVEFPAGHIGLSVSRKAHRKLWPRVAKWLAARSDPGGGGEAVPASPERGAADAGPWSGVECPAGDLQSISGIGPRYEERLARAGVTSVYDLRTADLEGLSERSGIPRALLERWTSQGG